MRILFALPGLHRVDRGAEIAFISVARQLAAAGDTVTLMGSGADRPGQPYRFLHASCVPREKFEKFPTFPILRNEYAWEELSFTPGMLRQYRPGDYDVTLTCGYPFMNWALRRPVLSGKRPAHIFVTQNGDWPAHATNSEYRFFGCDGLVCINPDAYERNRARWRSALIPNGVDLARFNPGPAERAAFGLPGDRPIVLMVSALIASKRVDLGIRAVAQLADAHLVVAGDGPERDAISALAHQMLPGRFTRLSLTPDRMPALYRTADTFLHLSKDESFGNVFVEAMACGRPIVGLDSPRLRWIVGGDEFLVTDDRPEGIAEQLEHALADPPDAAAARATKAQPFSWANIGLQYRRFIEDVVGTRPAR